MLLLQRLKLEMPVTGCLPPAFRSTSSYMKVRRPVYIITTSPPSGGVQTIAISVYVLSLISIPCPNFTTFLFMLSVDIARFFPEDHTLFTFYYCRRFFNVFKRFFLLSTRF